MLKLEEKMKDEEGEKSENERKRQSTNEVERRMKTIWRKWCL